jgi:hypothetical protein
MAMGDGSGRETLVFVAVTDDTHWTLPNPFAALAVECI